MKTQAETRMIQHKSRMPRISGHPKKLGEKHGPDFPSEPL